MQVHENERGISISVPTHPYRELPQCPACGFREDHWWRRLLRSLKGKKPKTVVSYRFCPGNKPPTEENKSIFASMVWGDREIKNECAGLEVPHLHATCSHCSAQWLSDTKEAA